MGTETASPDRAFGKNRDRSRGRWKSPILGNGIVKKAHAMFAELKIHICHRYCELGQTSKVLCTMGSVSESYQALWGG